MARKLVTKAQGRTIATNVTAFGPWTKGVNEKSEVFLLNSDELSGASNIILDDNTGVAHKRPGSIFVSSVPYLVNPPTVGYVFIDPSGKEILILTDDKKIVATENFITYQDITPTAFLLNGVFSGNASNMDFATAEGKVWFTNGVDPVCSWDGLSPVVVYDKATPELTWDALTDTQLSISDPELERNSDGTTWLGQIITCVDATNEVNIGQSQKIIGFDDATNTVSFQGFPGAIVNGDKFIVGVAIPRGRYIKYHHNTLFVATTPENPQEIRFHNDVDPNEPGITIQIDNPNAWPPVNQIEVDGGGDRIWGFTNPVYRNRIGVFKSSGIYRIEPDPTFRFVPVTITEQFGSRFPRTWQQKGDVLMFLGQDTDGKPDIMTTDFVTVKSYNRKHHKTLDNLLQPRTVFKNRYFSNDASWSSGTKSTFANSLSGALLPGSPSDTIINLPLTETGPKHDPNLGDIYFLPWDKNNGLLNGGNAEVSLAYPNSYYLHGLTNLPTSQWNIELQNYFNSSKNILWSGRVQFTGNDINKAFIVRLGNGIYESTLVLRQTGSILPSTFNGVVIPSAITPAVPGLTSNRYEVTVFLRPDGFTILTFGGVEVSRVAPQANGYNGLTLYSYLAAASSSVLIDRLVINGDCANWGTASFIDDNIDAPLAAHPIRVVGDLANGNLSLWVRSSDTPDFSSGNDPAGYVQVANGAIPTCQLRRYREVVVGLSWGFLDISVAPAVQPTQTIENIYGGATWYSPEIFIGPNISSWLAFIANIVLPAGSTTTVHARYALTANPPTATDWSPFFPIANGQNIGTAIGDVTTPPSARWLQLRTEQGIALSGDIPRLESVSPTWFEGGGVTLLTSSVIYNKKWLTTAARVTSGSNDIIIQVDSNDAISNWDGLNTNILVWFKGKLYINRGSDVLELTPSVLNDDAGPGPGSSRVVVPILAYLETNQEISGAGAARKRPRYLDMVASVSGPTLQVSYKRDDQAVFTPFRTVQFPNGTRQQRMNMPLGFQYYRLVWRIENNQLGTDLGVDGLIMLYSLVPSVSGK